MKQKSMHVLKLHDKMEKFKKKWTLPLDSVPLNLCSWNYVFFIFCKFIVYRIVMYLQCIVMQMKFKKKELSYHADNWCTISLHEDESWMQIMSFTK